MKKKRPSKTARARRAKGAISPDLRELVQELQRVHAEAERVGIFIGDRELLQCKTCGLTDTQPGQMAFEVMPVVATSSAVDLVKPTRPCLAAT